MMESLKESLTTQKFAIRSTYEKKKPFIFYFVVNRVLFMVLRLCIIETCA